METGLLIEELVSKAMSELKRLQYAEHTLMHYQAFWNKLMNYAQQEGERYYTEALGAKYLREYFAFPSEEYMEKGDLPSPLKYYVRYVRVLGDFQRHGTILRKSLRKRVPIYAEPFASILAAYEAECRKREYSERAMRGRKHHLQMLTDFLQGNRVDTYAQITGKHLSEFASTLLGYHPKTVAGILSSVRSFLEFLYETGVHVSDMREALPKIILPKYPRVPSAWKTEDIYRMLECVDRGNPAGKRDYAILLFVTHLGMRIGDVKELKLTNLDWDNSQIVFTQQKTRRKTSLPLLENVGWAIIDYIKTDRPPTDSPYLFVRHKAPYDAFGKNANLHNVVSKYTVQAGVKIPQGHRHGMHSLRHTLASTLLEQNTPLPLISEILGHMSVSSTEIYLKIDLEGLRRCALDPEEVFCHA